MNDARIRIRLNKSLGELEIEASPEIAAEWWDKLWPELQGHSRSSENSSRLPALPGGHGTKSLDMPEVFGEFFSEYPANLTDVDKVLAAGAFAQTKDPDRVFTTKTANQLLIDQNVKVTNASECVRRLAQSKRAFVVSEGRFRVSAIGFEYLQSLKPTS